MRFEDMLSDLEKLVGLRLQSIKPGSDLRLEEVDRKDLNIRLMASNGDHKSRPFSELEKIWLALCKEPAVHVDKVLGGSGSSRNQPETLIANLPYIEWCYLEGKKKHLVLKPGPTHHYGTLKKMDDIEALSLSERIKGNQAVQSGTVVIVTDDISVVSSKLEHTTGVELEAIDNGVYQQIHSGLKILIIPLGVLNSPLASGTYVVIKGKAIPPTASQIIINEQTYYAVSNNGMNILMSLD
ncbi:hypothetical protein SAMN02799624_01797 [Paenibacillus sp. UNC496MF]|uniref:hypothetical protein n=1 Tax=Paenibacillus sp. UNC496MF TaxID=1502753 RepID=UPI0008E768DC|nr:hypothetical protein [Paenibacillus sp. UNC496MF]SFI70280.1 hypothetical protein SAMN02799624_01797 [Paenibacillus sp. UNC496MF]